MPGGLGQLAYSLLGQQLASNQVLTVVPPTSKLQNSTLFLRCCSLYFNKQTVNGVLHIFHAVGTLFLNIV